MMAGVCALVLQGVVVNRLAGVNYPLWKEKADDGKPEF
jgi:hypothetical protein